MTRATLGKWRARFIERRIAGLYDDMRPGPPRSMDDKRVASLITTTLHTKPADGATHWSVQSVAAETGISKASVQRYFQLFGLQPHRWHMHFVPIYSSWPNQVERFFALVTDKAIRCGSFTSVKQLVSCIDRLVAHHNTHCQPFRCTATADSILKSCIDFAHLSAGQRTSGWTNC
jgi:AraC-like DNA-binding protein